MTEYDVWFELYALHPEAEHISQRSTFVADFDTREDAYAYAEGYFDKGEMWQVRKVCGLDKV